MTWAALDGCFDFGAGEITFKGEPTAWKDAQGHEQTGLAFGVALTSETFSGGRISAEVKFHKISPLNSCELVFFNDPVNKAFLSAGLGPPNLYTIRQWNAVKGIFTTYAATGDRRNLKPNEAYSISVAVQGSRVSMYDGGVEVLSTIFPSPVPPSQVGIFCFDDATVSVRNFCAEHRQGRVFVIMQFSGPFNEVYEHVIKEVCGARFGLDARRADDATGPGVIMADVINDMIEAEFVIAEITPTNPNVYYELGFAHAIGKPVIMLANKKGLPQLPFDVAGARVLFYEDSIAGRSKFEEQLTKHIESILEKRTLPAGRSGLTPG